MADETTPTTEATPAPTLAAGPWQSDIEAAFTDPQVRATVDAFLRSRVQPRMTQLEQQVATTENARALWDAFQEDPASAYAAITAELYGEEAATVALDALRQRLTAQEPAPTATTTETSAPAADPRLDKVFTYVEEQQAREQQQAELEAYDAEVARIVSDPANADIDPDLFHTFVAAAEGDFNQAIERYRSFAAAWMAKTGAAPTAETVTEEANSTAPPVMGSSAGGAGATPPTQPEYRGQAGLHQAIEDAVAAMSRTSEAPPVA